MFPFGALNNLNALGSYDYIRPWFAEPSLALNGVLPSLIHQYDKSRYYTTTSGQTNFPFTATRAGNATQHDSQGRIVWAPANNIFDSRGGSAVVGPSTGSSVGGVWSSSDVSASGVNREVVGKGVIDEEDYIDIRYYGTSTSGGNIFPDLVFHITSLAPVTTPGEVWTAAGRFQIVGGTNAGFLPTGRPRFQLRFMTAVGGYISGGPSTSITETEQFMVSTAAAPATTGRVSAFIDLAIPPGGVVDCTIRIRGIRLERTGADSPKRYIRTTGTAEYLPRLDYDPLTLAPRGLFIEPTATNLIPTSTAVSTITGGTSATSPATHLGQSAMRVTFDTLTSGHFAANGSLTVAASTQYTVSCYYKPISGGNDLIQLTVTSGAAAAGVYANFNTATGTRVALGVDATDAVIRDCGNGVFRLSITFTSIAVPASGSVVILAKIANAADPRIPSTTGAGEIFDFFGCQIETGSVATSLIPTFGTSATRATDTFLTTSVGWANLSGGTFYVEAFRPHAHTGGTFTNFGDSSGTNNRNQFRWSGNNIGLVITSAGVVQATSPVSFTVASGNIKAACRYSVGNQMLSANGALTTAGNITTLPAAQTHFMVGQLGATSEKFNGWIKEIRYYPDFSASDAQLQALTTP